MNVQKLTTEIFTPLELQSEHLNEMVQYYTLERTTYEQYHNAETHAAYQEALFNLKKAHIAWKALFSQLIQTRRL